MHASESMRVPMLGPNAKFPNTSNQDASLPSSHPFSALSTACDDLILEDAICRVLDDHPCAPVGRNQS